MTKDLITKYNTPVPRYTSYPPANYFEDSFSSQDYLQAVEISNEANPSHISFYIHIPFCRHLCHYCGCNSFPMMNQENIDRYVDALLKEIKQVKSLLSSERKIAQVHYGGGTPTVLPVATLKMLNEYLLEGFETIENPEIAIECHPGYLDRAYWEDLTKAHFNRFSLGVQDFNEQVLKTSNRKPSLLPVEEIFDILKSAGARINLDFIYGLPHQTVDSFAQTITRAAALKPDRLVTFSYAHVPWVSKRQLILEKVGLPSSEDKKLMFEKASEVLKQAGYYAVGMDHFVREDDELNQALQTNELHRNFQGYCTRRTTGQIYAFGVTGISQLNSAYAQNIKDIKSYIQAVEQGELPIVKGYKLSGQQQIIRTVIETLMCNYSVNWQKIADYIQKDKAEVLNAIRYNQSELQEFADDGLIEYSANDIRMTEIGKLFVRNIAASLDPLMENSTKSFSKPV
ncbi:oxygen-independent coproporphyrinogen III oxidase [Bacteroides propionicifaciens]|uniref:oxygen-independent coproporphyrinogen III oxidase n=1 Tax=Bacteroides propionicifaciens TaxID=392838 RepID=UPI00039D5DAD|nr:oxygen-independent coproporphyrinogen III oxidase [Bacteroides propionicifaciens]